MTTTSRPIPYFKMDSLLEEYSGIIEDRYSYTLEREKYFTGGAGLDSFAMGHYYYGMHFTDEGWVFREWAPNATEMWLIGTFSDWKEEEKFRLNRINKEGVWEIKIPSDEITHLQLYKLRVRWQNGSADRIPSYARRVVQDDATKNFSAQIWAPDKTYEWQIPDFKPSDSPPLIYEAHIGMATEREAIGSYSEFATDIIPVISKAGYNTIQLMAIQEHPYYGSFGYHVSNFFAVSSRFGTPCEFKELVDTAHQAGLRVIIDLVHSHSVRNENEGLALFDGSETQYFHGGARRVHSAWDSLCFDYGKSQVIHFLLSNCRYWLEEYNIDGFRFDGITSMLYYDHGLDKDFTSYSDYFNGNQDRDAIVYLSMANRLVHQIKPLAITIAEEMSGMPGVGAPLEQMGMGFDFRLAMGIPDYWIKLVKDRPDEEWPMGEIYHELTQHRPEEKTISYCESHDQALVGDKTLMFRMADSEMYTGMDIRYKSIVVDRAMALHKMIRLITIGASGNGYLNFMGNEFGHPEWIDFPRKGNNWSMRYARRQWSLLRNEQLKYSMLAAFDREMIRVIELQGWQYSVRPELLLENNIDKVIAFRRGKLLFVFNFHPERSYTDYGLPIKGIFTHLMDTDSQEFGGYNRIDSGTIYRSVPAAGGLNLSGPLQLKLYLPARTGIVLSEKRTPTVREL